MAINIADERRTRQLEEKFKIKGAHERDITFFTRILYVLLHVASGLGAISSLYFIHFNSKIEQLVSVLISVSLIGLNEYFKGKKMEYYASLKILSTDEDKSLEERERADDDISKAFFLVLGFWTFSIFAVGFSGYIFGSQKVEHRFTAENYDETLRNSANAGISAVNNAIAQGAGSKTIQSLKSDMTASVQVWRTHKERVDSDNKRNKSDNEDEALIMGLIYILIGVALEFVLYIARMWHESEEYAVLKSRKKQQKAARNSDKTDGKTLTVKNGDLKQSDIDEIIRQGLFMQRALQERDQRIARLEGVLLGK